MSARSIVENLEQPLYAAANGWLSPDGEWVGHRSTKDAHEWLARDWLKAQGTPVVVPPPDPNYDARPGMRELWRRGWLRVVAKSDTLLAHAPHKTGIPTPRQLAELENRAIERGFSRIVLDNDNSYKIIWSSDQV